MILSLIVQVPGNRTSDQREGVQEAMAADESGSENLRMALFDAQFDVNSTLDIPAQPFLYPLHSGDGHGDALGTGFSQASPNDNSSDDFLMNLTWPLPDYDFDADGSTIESHTGPILSAGTTDMQYTETPMEIGQTPPQHERYSTSQITLDKTYIISSIDWIRMRAITVYRMRTTQSKAYPSRRLPPRYAHCTYCTFHYPYILLMAEVW
jgi:hypothetical protein